MRKWMLIAALTLVPATASAHIWGVKGNDTGGIIPWSPEIAYIYRDIAATHCAFYNKLSVITSVRRRYGDYIGFSCRFPRGYDPVKAYAYAVLYPAPLAVRARY